MKNIMKDIALGFLLVGAGWSAGAQEQHSWNPYVNQGIVSPAPLLPVEFNGTGVLSFNVGNTGSDPLPLVLAQEMTLVITLSDGVPDNADPLAALGGTWKDMFNWSYDPAHNTYTGIQNQDIPGSSLGTITIQYKVTNNTPITVSSNGFNVNLQPPSYSNGFNVTDDDQVSSYTYVRARDFGDAPSSYGFAVHDINVFRDPDPESDLYNLYINYMYMGVSVDPETANQPSDMADGDDSNGTDDENGVVFPALVRGTTVTIPVVVTVYDYGSGLLNAWFDWNGNGSFESTEKVTGGTIYGDGSTPYQETVNLSVTVPASAVIGPTFARFRFGGGYSLPTGGGSTTYGEVEDYRIIIGEPTAVTLADFRATSVPGQGALLTWKTLLEVDTLGFHLDLGGHVGSNHPGDHSGPGPGGPFATVPVRRCEGRRHVGGSVSADGSGCAGAGAGPGRGHADTRSDSSGDRAHSRWVEAGLRGHAGHFGGHRDDGEHGPRSVGRR